MSTRVFGSVLTLALSTSFAESARAATPWPPPAAAQAAERALRLHPELQAARLQPEADRAAASRGGAWAPPEIAVDFYNAPLSSFPDPLRRQEEIDWSVSQMIPFPGKLRRMTETEHRGAAASEARAAAVARDLRRRALTAWADAYAAAWSLRIARETREDAAALARQARAGYAGGTGANLAALRAERALLEMDAAILRMDAMNREAQALLNAAAGGDSVIAVAAVDTLSPPVLVPPLQDVGDLAARPDLEALRRDRAMADAAIAAARAERLPDFMVRGMYKDMRGSADHGGAARDSWGLMIGMSVPFIPIAPWAAGVGQAERRARLLRDKADREVAALELMAAAEAEGARAAYEGAIARLVLTRGKIAPLAERILAGVRAEYAAGLADFAEVTEALREARMAREALRLAEAECLKAWALWEWAAGGE